MEAKPYTETAHFKLMESFMDNPKRVVDRLF
jgi:hypothetical protein